jgi:hypothetical protein
MYISKDIKEIIILDLVNELEDTTKMDTFFNAMRSIFFDEITPALARHVVKSRLCVSNERKIFFAHSYK